MHTTISLRTRTGHVLALVLLLVAFRSAVFVISEQAHFDSDQAVYGLMTKHLVEGRAFPVFMYGQRYMLAVSVYLAAPLVWLFGPGVAALKLVVLLLNLAAAVLLYRLLEREAKLPPAHAAGATLFFVLPPVLTSSRLAEFAGCNIEAFVWILLLWVVRARPVLLGVIGALGFLNREFVAYGLAAMLILDGTVRRRALVTAPVFVATAAIVLGVARAFSTNHFGAPRPLGWHFDFTRLAWLFEQNLTDLFGLRTVRLADFNIATRVSEGSWIAGVLLAGALGVAGWRALWFATRGAPKAGGGFPLYLCLVGVFSMAGYVCLAPVVADRMLIRYTLLALLLPCGVVAAFLAVETSRALRGFVLASAAAWALLNLWPHARLHVEYLTQQRVSPYRVLADHLEARHLEVGLGPYWTAYHVTYLAGERVIVAADALERIPAYRERYEAATRRFLIQDAPCRTPGTSVMRWCVSVEGELRDQGPR